MNSLSNDSLKNFGDKEWTEKKLTAFEKYVKAYLKIMHSQRRIKRLPSKIIYFDGFAGSGINSYNCGKSLNENENQLSFLNEEEGIDVYNGAAERVVKMPEKFDHYFFVDINEKAIETLEEKLNIYNTNKNFTFLCEDVNNAVDKLIQKLDRNSAALVLFDPFGMQLK
ncbi:MAG: three-Cys-motif partner protein TcmP [Limisphaerales bacterium]